MPPDSRTRQPVRQALAVALLACAWGGLVRADSVVVFNELHYHPAGVLDPEWIELHNQMAIDVDLSDWRMRGGVDFDFPSGTVIPAGGYLVVAGDPGRMEVPALGPWDGSLANDGEEIRLRNNSGRLMDRVDYRDRGRWPIGPDGSGATLAKADEDTMSGHPASWTTSREVGGTPGAANFSDGSEVEPALVIIPIDGQWRYNEGGVALPEDWARSTHAVGIDGWKEGAGLLGFETTPASLPEALATPLADTRQNDFITYYFETEFQLSAAQVARVRLLEMRHVIDDGAIFYLNGAEVGPRFNMSAGAVTSETTSNAVVRNADYEGPFSLSTANLVEGINRISVEVHQQAANSSDIIFGLELSLSLAAAAAEGDVPVVINELSGTGEDVFRIELANRSSGPMEVGGMVIASVGVTDASVMLPGPQVIGPDGFLVLDEALLGFRPENGDRLFVFSPGRLELLAAARADDLPRAWSPAHGRHLVPDGSSFGSTNTFSINSDIVINEIMYHFREDPGVAAGEPLVERSELIGFSDSWRYNDTGDDLGGSWAGQRHLVDGVDWFSGPGLHGFELGNLPEPIRTQFPSPVENEIVTYYLEREFTLTEEQLRGSLSLEMSHIIDDGAVIYLNGVEVERYNLPGGPISATTLASTSIRDARLQGVFELPAANLVVGENRISVEVHQDNPGNSDVVFGLQLVAVSELAPPVETQPIVERDEEWVELFNKGTQEVDLTGWSIDGGIDFNFAEGTRIPAGGFLVVAKDTAELVEKYPALAKRVVGDYRNRLNNGRDLIRLEDELENPVDEVEYVEGGRWPDLADGRGSSLELRDARADNSNPQSWEASEEGDKEDWELVSYRETGGQSYGLTVWNEFRLGMLQAGEVLIDDVSVIRDPDGVREQLIQNGNFSSGANHWRMIGNHRHSEVIDEPGNGGNKVLRLVATGATDTRHNHLETTFVNNTNISGAQTYEVSFQVRWMAGSNQLNSRCYYQRLARTTQLARPERCGTPGAVNSRAELNIGPTFSDLRHHPPVPAVNDGIEVRAHVADPDGLGDIVLKARYAEGPVQTFSFSVDEDGEGVGQLPGASAGTVIQFWVEALDARGIRSMAPPAGPDSRALIQVEDNQGTNLPLQEIRLIMLGSDRNFLLSTLNLMSNERLGGTAIYNRKKITYDVGVRLRGSGAGRARDGSSVRSFSIAFPDDDLFRGVHGSVGADRSARSPVGRRPDEIYVKHMFNHAGVPCMYDDLVHMIGPSSTYSGLAMLQMARYGALFMETQFEDGDKGAVFNLDITYDPVTSQGGAEGFKPPVPFQHIGTDIRDLGDEEEDYRTSFEIRSGRRRDDYSALMEFCKVMSLPSAELDRRIESVMNVDQWMRYTALMVLCGIGDTFVLGGLKHNIRMYAPGGSGPVVALPWDNDFVFSAGTSSSMFPMNGNLRRVVEIPRVRRLYWGHIHHLVGTTFGVGYMDDWLAHYGDVMGHNLSGQAGYISARGNHALSQLPAQIPFRVTSGEPGDITVNGTLARVTGQGWINVREMRLAGSPEPLPLIWSDDRNWQVSFPVLPGVNEVGLEVYDFSGDLITTVPLTITSNASGPQPVESLRVTELHFNPLGSDETEFVELKNIGGQSLDISGASFADGIDFVVPPNTTLAAGEFALVVRNRVAFEAFYGEGFPILGEFAPDALSNGGERIELRDASGNVVQAFSYTDAWYPAADGGGYSLVVRDAQADVASWGMVSGWALSRQEGGNPNAADVVFALQFEGWQREHFNEEQIAQTGVSGPLGDADGDGFENLWSYAAGQDPWKNLRAEFLPRAEMHAGRLRLFVRVRVDAVDLQIAAEFGEDLVSWSRVDQAMGATVDHGDGTQTLVFEDVAEGGVRRFGRGQVTLSSP